MIFEHTSKEKGMWRGWLKNGQSVDFVWKKRGWEFGAGIHVHSDDDDNASRMLFIRLWRFVAVFPLGIRRGPISIEDEPQWSAYASSEFGMTFHWGMQRKSFDWPWSWYTLAYEVMMEDGTWQPLRYGIRDGGQDDLYIESHHYAYTLKTGEVQRRMASVSKRRHIICWRMFKILGWPRWIKRSINIEFDGEVGEGSGSWKGGCIGCTYDLRSDETMLEALRRMEKDRAF